ncbi:unnamed protein product [Candida verbasci]|uniref:ATP synthase subunit H, mitochondrial n=1 Tax=Candida verbasci TaxID=1227364 RepID=A0A9W4X9Y9_9ASCO|nr:unnamed protein product [Candida verbasci]
MIGEAPKRLRQISSDMSQRLQSKRLFSITPQRSNLVGDLYIQHIKSFKPKSLTQEEIDATVKKFQLPSKPTLPQVDLSSEEVKAYEQSEVETETNDKSVATEENKDNQDWFVFDEVEEEAH